MYAIVLIIIGSIGFMLAGAASNNRQSYQGRHRADSPPETVPADYHPEPVRLRYNDKANLMYWQACNLPRLPARQWIEYTQWKHWEREARLFWLQVNRRMLFREIAKWKILIGLIYMKARIAYLKQRKALRQAMSSWTWIDYSPTYIIEVYTGRKVALP